MRCAPGRRAGVDRRGDPPRRARHRVAGSQRALDRPIIDDRTFPPAEHAARAGTPSVAAAVALVVLLLAKPAQRRLAAGGCGRPHRCRCARPRGRRRPPPERRGRRLPRRRGLDGAVLLVAGRGAPAWRAAGRPRIAALAGVAAALVALAVLGVAALRAPDHVPEPTNVAWLAGLALVAAIAVVVVACLAPSLLARSASNEGVPSGPPPD